MPGIGKIVSEIVYGSVHLLEAMGFVIILISACRAFWEYCTSSRGKEGFLFNRIRLAEGLAAGLEFKLGGEILRTVVVQSLDDIYFIAGIVALRAAMTFMIYWEIKNEKGREAA